jgi:hypothetical protein
MTISRRDFLRFRVQARRRIVFLSCERLYMRFMDAQSGDTRSGGPSAEADSALFVGEPDTVLHEPSSEAFWRELESTICACDVVCVQEPQWMANGEFGSKLRELLMTADAQGVEVSYIGHLLPGNGDL